MASHTADLAVSFGRRVRNLVGMDSYKHIFPQVELQADSKSASRWGTNFNGEYFAIGVGGALAGRGADRKFFKCGYLSITHFNAATMARGMYRVSKTSPR